MTRESSMIKTALLLLVLMTQRQTLFAAAIHLPKKLQLVLGGGPCVLGRPRRFVVAVGEEDVHVDEAGPDRGVVRGRGPGGVVEGEGGPVRGEELDLFGDGHEGGPLVLVEVDHAFGLGGEAGARVSDDAVVGLEGEGEVEGEAEARPFRPGVGGARGRRDAVVEAAVVDDENEVLVDQVEERPRRAGDRRRGVVRRVRAVRIQDESGVPRVVVGMAPCVVIRRFFAVQCREPGLISNGRRRLAENVFVHGHDARLPVDAARALARFEVRDVGVRFGDLDEAFLQFPQQISRGVSNCW
mmetsp:Transcript_8204/g.25331  ORF Transcript_8204/g.25331 Transcript_8204/m.25331 type:complete len:298 (-) Transcript_8204:30-923(-)